MKKFLSIALSIIMALCVMPAGVAFASGDTINAGETVTVTLEGDGDTYILIFVPQRTSVYRIASHTENFEDPKCDIFDSKGSPVASCDDDANANFVITQEFQKGDIGVGGREIGYLFGQYKRIRGLYEGVLTGKGLSYGGSLIRTQATGYGLVYMLNEMVKAKNDTISGKTLIVTGSGNVAIYAVEKAAELGGKVVAMCDSNGYIYDPEGIKLDIVKDIKEVKRGRIKEYADRVEGATYTEGKGIWNIKCDIYLPCATQNELDLDAVKILIANGCKYVAEGANMPTTREATDYLMANGVTFMPGKAANAGGVATSALEMCQNSARLSWTAEEVDTKLHQIMVDIFNKVDDASKRYGMEGNYVAGANIAGFEKVVDAMIAQGIV